MTIPFDQADIEAVWTAAEVDRWSKGVDANVTDAIAKGWSEIRSAALNRYDPVSFDALTVATLPAVVRGYAVDLATDWLSSGNKRSEEIETRAERARRWLGLLATGYDHNFDDLVMLLTSTTGTMSIRISSPQDPMTFDREDRFGGLRARIKRI